jgi:hypothetical protein
LNKGEIGGDLIFYLILRNNKHNISEKNVSLCGAKYFISKQQSANDDSGQISIKTVTNQK